MFLFSYLLLYLIGFIYLLMFKKKSKTKITMTLIFIIIFLPLIIYLFFFNIFLPRVFKYNVLTFDTDTVTKIKICEDSNLKKFKYSIIGYKDKNRKYYFLNNDCNETIICNDFNFSKKNYIDLIPYPDYSSEYIII